MLYSYFWCTVASSWLQTPPKSVINDLFIICSFLLYSSLQASPPMIHWGKSSSIKHPWIPWVLQNWYKMIYIFRLSLSTFGKAGQSILKLKPLRSKIYNYFFFVASGSNCKVTSQYTSILLKSKNYRRYLSRLWI